MNVLRIIIVGGLAVAAYLLAVNYRDIVRYRQMRDM